MRRWVVLMLALIVCVGLFAALVRERSDWYLVPIGAAAALCYLAIDYVGALESWERFADQLRRRQLERPR